MSVTEPLADAAPVPVLQLRNVWKTYRGDGVEVHALRGVDLDVQAGEYVAIMGPSGSGKSTLMNVIGCLDVASHGQYVLDGEDVAHLTDKLLGTRTKVYVLVVTLPFSDKFWAEGFCDMRQKSWQEGQIHAFEEFGGVPRMWVPDNAATATDRTAAPRVTQMAQ